MFSGKNAKRVLGGLLGGVALLSWGLLGVFGSASATAGGGGGRPPKNPPPAGATAPARPSAPLTAADRRFFRHLALLFVGGLLAIKLASAAMYHITHWMMYTPADL